MLMNDSKHRQEPVQLMAATHSLQKRCETTRADAPSWGRALALAGMPLYAGNHRGMSCTIGQSQSHQKDVKCTFCGPLKTQGRHLKDNEH